MNQEKLNVLQGLLLRYGGQRGMTDVEITGRATATTITQSGKELHLTTNIYGDIMDDDTKKIIKKSGLRGSAVSGAAYQSAEKLFSEYDGRTKNYAYKQPELVSSELMIPANAPPEYSDRAALWNAVEKAETRFDAQLSRGIIAALPKKIPFDQPIAMVKEYCQENFVSKGMCCDIAIHDPSPPGYNPHVHIMLTMPFC